MTKPLPPTDEFTVTGEMSNPGWLATTPAELAFARWRGDLRLWTGVLGPPIIWAIHFQASYALALHSSAAGHRLELHVAMTVALAATIAGGLLSWLSWKRLGVKWPTEREGGVLGRSRFMAAFGVLSSAMFTLTLAAQAAAEQLIPLGTY